MSVVPIRKNAPLGAPSKTVEANQKAVDALPFNSGMWRVEGVPGLYVRCRAQSKTFRLERRIDSTLVKKDAGRAHRERSEGRGYEHVGQDEAEAGGGRSADSRNGD